MCGTLRWYWTDSESGAHGSLDCLSEDAARGLAKALLLASERSIYKFEWICDADDRVTEIKVSWSPEDV